MSEPATTPTETTFSVSLTFTHQMLADLITTFVESGDPVTRSWCQGLRPVDIASVQDRRFGRPWYASVKIYQTEDMIFIIKADEAKGAGVFEKEIRISDFARGMSLLATHDKGAYAHQFQNILEDNHDATTADILMQLIVYGEEVFA